MLSRKFPSLFSQTRLIFPSALSQSFSFGDPLLPAYFRTSSVIFMEQKCGPHIEHPLSPRLPSSLKAATWRDGGTGNCAKKSHGVSDKSDDDDGFAALAQLESRRVALGSPPQSLGEDAQAETA